MKKLIRSIIGGIGLLSLISLHAADVGPLKLPELPQRDFEVILQNASAQHLFIFTRRTDPLKDIFPTKQMELPAKRGFCFFLDCPHIMLLVRDQGKVAPIKLSSEIVDSARVAKSGDTVFVNMSLDSKNVHIEAYIVSKKKALISLDKYSVPLEKAPQDLDELRNRLLKKCGVSIKENLCPPGRKYLKHSL